LTQSHEEINDPTKTETVPNLNSFTQKGVQTEPFDLDTIARKYTCIVGEKRNVKTLLCCFVSKDLPAKYRLSTIISNNSSTGKSYLLNNVLAPFYEDVIDYTDFTEAHFKRKQTNLNGKIIKIEQLERMNEDHKLSMNKLKHMLSEGRLKFGVVDKNEKGQNTPTEFEILGFPIFVTTVTKFDIDSETANRVLMMTLDESEIQTERIMDYTLNEYSSLNTNELWKSSQKELTDLFKKYKRAAQHIDGILIPFSDKLKKILPRNLEMRRDLQKILNLTCIIAFFHWQNRVQLVNKNGKHFIKDVFATTEKEFTYYVVAKTQDFIEALEIAGQTIKQTINKSSFRLMELQALIKKVYSENGHTGITVRQLKEPAQLSENRVREYLNELIDLGFIEADYSEKEFKYSPTEKKFSELDPTNLLYSDKEYEEWLKSLLEANPHLAPVVSSCDQKGAQNEPYLPKEGEIWHDSKLRDMGENVVTSDHLDDLDDLTEKADTV